MVEERKAEWWRDGKRNGGVVEKARWGGGRSVVGQRRKPLEESLVCLVSRPPPRPAHYPLNCAYLEEVLSLGRSYTD